MNGNDKLMTATELAEFLNVPLSSIYDLSHKKTIPVIKLGQRLRFRRSAIETWLENKTVKEGVGNGR